MDQFSAWTSLHRSALLLISAKMIQNLPGETPRHIFTIKLITAGGFGILDGNHGCVILFLKVSVAEESIVLFIQRDLQPLRFPHGKNLSVYYTF